MDLNPIGKHCSLQSCNNLDFLPIQCSCSEWFCKVHILPDLHNCASVQRHPQRLSESTSSRSTCAFTGCDKPCLTTAVDSSHAVQGACPGCQLSFCVHHRHMESHSCTSLTVQNNDTKHEAARTILSEKFQAPATSLSRTPVVVRQQSKLPPDSPKLAQLRKVNLMKLRHKAIPADPKDKDSAVPIDQRLHVTTRIEVVGQSAKDIALWFRKTTITGRALDLTAQHFGISHKASTLFLKKSSAEIEGQVLLNHLELSAQLEDGSTVVLIDSPSNN